MVLRSAIIHLDNFIIMNTLCSYKHQWPLIPSGAIVFAMSTKCVNASHHATCTDKSQNFEGLNTSNLFEILRLRPMALRRIFTRSTNFAT